MDRVEPLFPPYPLCSLEHTVLAAHLGTGRDSARSADTFLPKSCPGQQEVLSPRAGASGPTGLPKRHESGSHARLPTRARGAPGWGAPEKPLRLGLNPPVSGQSRSWPLQERGTLPQPCLAPAASAQVAPWRFPPAPGAVGPAAAFAVGSVQVCCRLCCIAAAHRCPSWKTSFPGPAQRISFNSKHCFWRTASPNAEFLSCLRAGQKLK